MSASLLADTFYIALGGPIVERDFCLSMSPISIKAALNRSIRCGHVADNRENPRGRR
jgi:hypothetical protein